MSPLMLKRHFLVSLKAHTSCIPKCYCTHVVTIMTIHTQIRPKVQGQLVGLPYPHSLRCYYFSAARYLNRSDDSGLSGRGN